MTIFLLTLLMYAQTLYSFSPDWSQEASLGKAEEFKSRENIYDLPEREWEETINKGLEHALIYPVRVTALLIPFRPLKKFFETDSYDPLRQLIFKGAQEITGFQSLEDIFNWLGVHQYPLEEENQANRFPEYKKEFQHPMGATLIQRDNVKGLTFSCAACHSASLFGKKVLGLTNRFPRANHFFHLGKAALKITDSSLFKFALQTTDEEKRMLKQTKKVMKWIATKKPQALGLDTSLAQVALSLSKRGDDEYATRYLKTALMPRPNDLNHKRADSKPAVWWNLKYKTRWLSDGSIVSGNPIFTNFLWNEIGRGTSLRELEKWLQKNTNTIKELTSAVFATKAPRYIDFFGLQSIDIEKAKKGEQIFNKSCQGCHGSYEKDWDSDEDPTQTTKVIYHAQTPVKNVGTDPLRYQGMQYFAKELNQLKISRWMKTVVTPQRGYVPPPLVGIWARWPYFHNNSIPNLCALMTRPEDRPKSYWAGEAIDKNKDFDSECLGYPIGNQTPREWKKDKAYYFDTLKEGLSNSGHYERIFTTKEGSEKYTWAEKYSLIEFLKTL